MQKRECHFGLGIVNIRAGASWRRPRAAPRPVRGAWKWVDWPGSVRGASAEKGASRPLHASGVERSLWSRAGPAYWSEARSPAGERDHWRGGGGSSTMKVVARLSGWATQGFADAVEQQDAPDGAGEMERRS